MTVRIPVEAEAAGVVRSIEQIRQTLERAGQAGRNFAQIDMSHPEITPIVGDLAAINQRLEQLSKVASGDTAAAMRKFQQASGITDGLGWIHHFDQWQQFVQARYVTPSEQARHVVNVGRYVLQGTNAAPPMPAPPPSPPAPGASPEPSGGGFFGGAAGSALSIAKGAGLFFLAQAGIGKIADMAAKAIGSAEDEAVSTNVLGRHLQDLGGDFAGLRDAVRQSAQGLRVNYGEMQRLTLQWVKATNEQDAAFATERTRFAVGFARGYGIDPSLGVSALGRAEYLGQDPRRFALLIGEAVQKGGQTGQVADVMQAFQHWMDSAARQNVTSLNIQDFAAMYSGLNATGLPGLKGANAEALISQIDSAVRQGGAAGPASMAVTYRALARRGITDPYQIQYLLAGGAFEHVGKDGSTMFDLMRGEVNTEYGALPYYQRINAMSNMFGINPRQAEQLMNFKPGDVGRADDMLRKYDLRLGGVDASGLADIGRVLADKDSDLDYERQKILKGGNLSTSEADQIGSASGATLRELLVRAYASHGQEKNMGTLVEEGNARIANALTEAGTGLVPVVADLKLATSGLVHEIGELSTVLGDWLAKQNWGAPADDSDWLPNGMPAGGVDDYGRPIGRDGLPITTPPPLSPSELDGKAAMARDRFAKDLNISPDAASGMVSNFVAESGLQGINEKHPRIPGSRGGFGWAQLTGDRRVAFEKWAQERNLDPASDEANIQYIEKELREKYPLVLAQLRAGKITPEQAANVVFDGYEAQGDLSLESKRVGHLARASRIAGLPAQPLPAGKGGPNVSLGGQGANFSIAPLRVVHESADGSPLHEEYLPIEMTPLAQPAGLGPRQALNVFGGGPL